MIPKQVVDVIEAVTDSIAAEIQRSLDFYMATSGDQGSTATRERRWMASGSAPRFAVPPVT
jgi:Tfp pilus assembly PilM family ATPase